MTSENQTVTLTAGETLFREGEVGDTAFLIEHGTIHVLHEKNGGRQLLASLGPGELLGEMSLIDRLPRSATAVAAVDARLRIITREQYDLHYRQADPMIRLMLRALLQRHRSSVGATHGSAEDVGMTVKLDREKIMTRLRTEHSLKLALDRGEYVLHFQPIVRISNQTTAGFEALLRWNSPDRGMISPATFIPVAEESDLIVLIGRWVLREGCAALSRLRAVQKKDESAPPLFLTVNVSGRHFESGALLDDVTAALSASNTGGGVLKLEVTESLLMKDVNAATDLVQRLKKLGAQLAVDDFGTGYSSLNYLHRLNADCLKVDRSFVQEIRTDPDSTRVLEAIKSLATTFNLETVVEGVENAEQSARLRQIGFDYIQGFCYSKPVPEDQAVALINRRWS